MIMWVAYADLVFGPHDSLSEVRMCNQGACVWVCRHDNDDNYVLIWVNFCVNVCYILTQKSKWYDDDKQKYLYEKCDAQSMIVQQKYSSFLFFYFFKYLYEKCDAQSMIVKQKYSSIL